MTTRLAFIGFGEAAQAMARGFHEEPGVSLSAHDVRFAHAADGPRLEALADELGVAASPTPEGAVRGAAVVLSLVTGSVAVRVAETVAPHLAPNQVFIDLNSVSPDTKRCVGAALAARCTAGYVEGAVMDAVKPRRHKAPILLAGARAAEIAGMLNGIGMNCAAAGETIGQASAVKMIRSVMLKGVEALIIESLGAAARAGVTERILDSVDATFPDLDWRTLATHYLRRTHEHGARRAAEMKESAETLRGLAMEAALTAAVSQTIAAAHARLSADPYRADATYPELLEALAGRGGIANAHA